METSKKALEAHVGEPEGGSEDLKRSTLDRKRGALAGKLAEEYWDRHKRTADRKDVLLVEGDDDVIVAEEVFKKRRASWATRLHILAAGGRDSVLTRMSETAAEQAKEIRFPSAYGLVDRDTWTDAEVDEMKMANPRLHVTQGWCLENLFLDPAWLRAYDLEVAARVARERERWVRAGAMWWTLQRAREAQQRWQAAFGWTRETYGAPREDLDLTSKARLAADLLRLIPEDVRQDAQLEIKNVAETFWKRSETILALSQEEQWQVGVCGKKAFRALLVPELDAVRGRRDPEEWRLELAGELQRPDPFDRLIAVLFQ